MNFSGYEFAHFLPAHEAQVVDLLQHLWKHDPAVRTRLFRWKYIENPHADRPLGVVALHKGRVVGFRGYFADRFVLAGHDDNIGILHPGDACVDPDHRNRGLSVAMGNLASQFDSSRYRLFMTMTCSKQSLPGNVKLGFEPLTMKSRLTQHGLNPIRWARSREAQDAHPLGESKIELGQFGDLLVSDSPLPADMASVIEAQAPARTALELHQSEAFFAWRYRNPVGKYVFYFLLRGKALRGFVAIDVSPNNHKGDILDYGERDPGALREILGFINRRKHFMALSILSYGADERLRSVLAELRFTTAHPLKQWMDESASQKFPLPILIRPIAQTSTDEPFLIGGVDVRKLDSWRLKPICSDAA